MQFTCKPFQALTTTELYAILQARTNVFVVEQNCPYPEVDGKDVHCLHVFATEGDDVIAYLRILPQGVSYEHVSIGRVLVAQTHRGQKLAYALMEEGLRIIAEQYGEQTIQIQAQTYLQTFYASFGFQAISASYLEDGIPHVDMLLKK